MYTPPEKIEGIYVTTLRWKVDYYRISRTYAHRRAYIFRFDRTPIYLPIYGATTSPEWCGTSWYEDFDRDFWELVKRMTSGRISEVIEEENPEWPLAIAEAKTKRMKREFHMALAYSGGLGAMANNMVGARLYDDHPLPPDERPRLETKEDDEEFVFEGIRGLK